MATWQLISAWLESLYTTVYDRLYYTYILITTSELAAVYFLATVLVCYFTVAITVFIDEARSAYKKMPK